MGDREGGCRTGGQWAWTPGDSGAPCLSGARSPVKGRCGAESGEWPTGPKAGFRGCARSLGEKGSRVPNVGEAREAQGPRRAGAGGDTASHQRLRANCSWCPSTKSVSNSPSFPRCPQSPGENVTAISTLFLLCLRRLTFGVLHTHQVTVKLFLSQEELALAACTCSHSLPGHRADDKQR